MPYAYEPQVHGRYVAHWTGGKDISHTVGNKLDKITDTMRTHYIERAFDTIETGLWMTTFKEELSGYQAQKIGYTAPIIAFTEIRAANISSHAHKYGLLGFVFEREFVLERNGGPVLYVDNEDWRSANIKKTLKVLSDLAGAQSVSIDRIPVSDQSLNALTTIKDSLLLVLGNLKPMHGRTHFDNYNESEWRIIHTHRAEKEGYLTKPAINSGAGPQYFVPFKIDELRILVLPDEKTRKLFFADSRFQDQHRTLNILTIEEYGQI